MDDLQFDASVQPAAPGLADRRLTWVVEALQRLGCDLNLSGRLLSARRALRRAQEDVSCLSNATSRRQVAEAHRLAWEFMIILMAAIDSHNRPSVFTKIKLEEMLGGSDDPHGGSQAARNTQFELFVPALFCVAGFEIAPGATDARWVFEGESLEIEAKRLSSVNQSTLRTRLRDAAKQILGAGSHGAIEVVKSRGLIAVNVDVHFDDLCGVSERPPAFDEFERRLKALDSAGRVLLTKHGIVGVLAFGYVAQWYLPLAADDYPRLDLFYPTRWASLVGTDPGEQASRQSFFNAVGRLRMRSDDLREAVPSWRPDSYSW
jgi:hypothetical protein